MRGLIEGFRGNSGWPSLKLIEVAENKGKPNTLNLGVEAAKGDFIVFADARQRFNDAAIKELVANFSDPDSGECKRRTLLYGWRARWSSGRNGDVLDL